MFFRKKEKKDYLTKLYEIFLDNIDDLSQTRLRGYDMSFNNLKNKLSDVGLTLTEIDCKGKDTLIKRNKKGFYVVKSCDKKIFNKYKSDFERIHMFLLDKEYIMSGNYKCHKRHKDELNAISTELGYGEIRDKILSEK